MDYDAAFKVLEQIGTVRIFRIDKGQCNISQPSYIPSAPCGAINTPHLEPSSLTNFCHLVQLTSLPPPPPPPLRSGPRDSAVFSFVICGNVDGVEKSTTVRFL